MIDDFLPLTQAHSRSFHDQTYVYPVISRRSRGLSIGINLSPTCLCNFLCAYCQVNGVYRQERESPSGSLDISLDVLEAELRKTVSAALDGSLYLDPWFARAPESQRRVNDIAFSGDGEPTLSPAFPDAVKIAVKVHKEFCPEAVKIVLITNATTFHLPKVAKTLEFMMQHHGEIWAKLDAGTPELYQKINRSSVPYETVLHNLELMSRHFSIVIQTIFLNDHGIPPTQQQIFAYIDRLNRITSSGGKIDRVQLYTIARTTIESWVSPLSESQMDHITQQIAEKTGLKVETFLAH